MITMYHPAVVALIQLVLVNATHFYDPASMQYYWTGLTLVGDGNMAYITLQNVCHYVAVDVNNTLYCSKDGRSWIETRALALFYPYWRSDARMVPFNGTVESPVGQLSGLVPEGWYAYGGRIFRLPEQAGEVGYIASLEAEFKKARAELAEARDRAARLGAELNATRKAAAELRAANSALEAELAAVRGELDAERLKSLAALAALPAAAAAAVVYIKRRC